jgi:hypothetical protein
MDFEKCTESSNNKIVCTPPENGKKFVINNKKGLYTIKKVKVDGCLIDDERERCDYLFETQRIDDSFLTVYYVELKGCDIEKAFSQLGSTLKYCNEKHCKAKKICYIVASRVPKAGTKVQNLKVKFTKTYQSEIHVKTQIAEVDL